MSPLDSVADEIMTYIVYLIIRAISSVVAAISKSQTPSPDGSSQVSRQDQPRPLLPSELPLQNPIGDLRTAFRGEWSLFIWIPLCALLTGIPGILLSHALNSRADLQNLTVVIYCVPMLLLALVLVRVADQERWSYRGYISLLILFSSCWAIFTAFTSFILAMGSGE